MIMAQIEQSQKSASAVKENKIRRPSIYQIKLILEEVDIGFATFGSLARRGNRKDTCNYLKLLVQDLGWLKKKQQPFASSAEKVDLSRVFKTFAVYELTEKGRAFLKLFPEENKMDETENIAPSNNDDDELTAREKDTEIDDKKSLARPSLFAIWGILHKVDYSVGHKVRFAELARCTPELRNRNKMVAYVKFLIEELAWLEAGKETKETLYNPFNSQARFRRWAVTYYSLSEKGKIFLELFPKKDSIAQEEEEKEPQVRPLTPQEERRQKWYEKWC
jgi:hypothetical protein